MMLTREQADTTWCPMVRRESLGGSNASVDNRAPRSSCCIADQCAMWRWGEARTERKREVTDAPQFGLGYKQQISIAVEVPTRGYCGLAGAPVIVGAAA